MKLCEAMNEVWKSEIQGLRNKLTKWLRKKNMLQWLSVVGGIFVLLVVWIPVGWIYFDQMGHNPMAISVWLVDGGVWTALLFFCFGLALLWTIYWMKVFDKWWPF